MENDRNRGRRVQLGRIETIGIGLTVLGAVLIGLGWYALADEPSVVEQLPYLASGGVGGLAVIVAGAALVHLTRQFRLEREVAEMAAGQDELREAVAALTAALGQSRDGSVTLSAVASPAGRTGRGAAARRTSGLADLGELSVTDQTR